MKKLVLILMIVFPLAVSAQEGQIVYDRAVKYEFSLPPGMESMRDQIPSEKVTSMVLMFNESTSVMKDATVAEESEISGGDRRAMGMFMRMRMGAGSRSDNETVLETYVDQDQGIVRESRDFMGRSFLIEGPIPEYAWKMSGELSEFLGYTVEKATAIQDTVVINAWFTSEIPVSTGPESYSGLPGAILVLSIDDDRVVYSAKEVNLESLEDDVLSMPTDGKALTHEEYEVLVEEKIAEIEALRRQRRRGGRGMMGRRNR